MSTCFSQKVDLDFTAPISGIRGLHEVVVCLLDMQFSEQLAVLLKRLRTKLGREWAGM